MSRYRFLPLILLLLTVLVMSAAGAQAPRAVPTNDNFANAKEIKVGKDYTVLDIGAATAEVDEPSISCGVGLFNSVWFSFTLDSTSYVYLAVTDVRLNDPLEGSIDSVLGVYTGPDLQNLTEAECNDDGDGDAYFSELVFQAAAGTTYYIAVGTYNNIDYVSGSSLVLRSRLTSRSMDPANSGFETPLAPADWKVKDATGDQVVCSNVSYPADNSTCAFKFTGNAGESSKLIQTMPFAQDFLPRKNAALDIYANFRVMDAAIGSAKVKYSILYSDGTPPTVATVNLSGRGTMGGYSYFNTYAYFASRYVAAIKIKVVFKSTTGVLLLDSFGMDYHAATSTRTASVLPLPPAAR